MPYYLLFSDCNWHIRDGIRHYLENLTPSNDVAPGLPTLIREAAKKVIFLVIGPLRGGGGLKAGPLKKIEKKSVEVRALVVGPLKR